MVDPRRHRRGNLIVTGASASVLLAFAAMVVDVSYLRVIDVQLDQAVRAASLAGAGQLDGTMEGIAAAGSAAATVGNMNAVMGGTDLVGPDVIIYGTVSLENDVYVFEELAPVDSNVDLINAIKVDIDHSSINPLLATAAFGTETLASRADAIAIRPFNWSATAVECFLPFALPDCNFEIGAESNGPGMFVSGAEQLGDNVGWAGVATVSARYVRDQLGDSCSGGEIAVTEFMNLQNGMIDGGLRDMGNYLADGSGNSTEPWPTDLFPQLNQGDATTVEGSPPPLPPKKGKPWDSLVNDTPDPMTYVMAGPVPIVDMAGEPGAGCGNAIGNWNQDAEILGFTYGFVYDVLRSGNSKGFYVQVDQVNEYDFGTASGPGAIGNVVDAGAQPFLVQI